MTDSSRVLCSALRNRIVSADEAVRFIRPGDNVGMSGFTGAAYPKAIPQALARRIEAAHLLGLGRNTLTRKINELGLEAERETEDPAV